MRPTKLQGDYQIATEYELEDQQSSALSGISRITSTVGIDGAAPWILLTSLLLEKWTTLFDQWMLPSFTPRGTAMRGLLLPCGALGPLPEGGHFSAPKRATAGALVALWASFERDTCSSTIAPGLSSAVPLTPASSVTITLGQSVCCFLLLRGYALLFTMNSIKGNGESLSAATSCGLQTTEYHLWNSNRQESKLSNVLRADTRGMRVFWGEFGEELLGFWSGWTFKGYPGE
ncbi:hypothetical protein DV515_00012640 [Chloebia gouldiae]|uniref:Uncharacterized protein n=1 Tax=Chloebia gouldiae TaxID=44316 RepID=A0A3L8S353_CHLGU|nr:hypothetical protein DV515_00012640 [Chloebia gouldiae]